MKRRMLASLLSLVILLGLMPPARVYAADGIQKVTAVHWFYDQLSNGAKGIYDALETAYKDGTLSDGTTPVGLNVGSKDVEDYIKGNRTLFNDFAAAKDAFDLEHPEAWYVDSSKLALTAEGTTASVGIGYSDTYYVDGVTDATGVKSKTEELETAIQAIVTGANAKSTAVEKIRYVHDEIINSISYKFEYECSPGNFGYIRTAYALVTHEGVCEGYARSFQYALNVLGIPCVLIHGVQNSNNDPEEHMWCAVYIDDEKGTGWYVVDPTWDDPVVTSSARSVSDGKGVDGGERQDYCLVGQDKIGSYWHPLGVVSTGGMEFEYPDIAPRSYGSSVLDTNGLKVEYDEGRMEGTASTVYQISYNGDGLVEAAKKGYYFLIQMYDVNADGSTDAIEEWYYSAHGLAALGPSYEGFDPVNFKDHGGEYFHDEPGCLVQAVSNCEYVAFAVTDIAPPEWKTPEDLLREDMDGYYTGEDDHILADTGLIYNPNGNYEQPPYVKNLTPAITEPVYVGRTYTIHAEFTDPLFHPDDASIEISSALGKVNDALEAQAEKVGMDYYGTTYSWGMNAKLPHTFADKPSPQNIRWDCEKHGVHTNFDGINSECRLTMLEFEFRPSDMWADDSVLYDFQLTGLVGVKSNKRLRPGSISFVFENMSAFCYYRCPLKGGIDWNLWGQPQMLDNPNNLDFNQIFVEGINGQEQSIADLYGSMNLDQYDMNGRLLLVVENVRDSQARGQEMADVLNENGVDLYDSESVLASMLYEIDFARVCSKTVVKTGDSLRMQVGFPAGFDVSNLAGTVFKIYHFIKDKNTNEITGVEEIPVTVTPYGLVFVVNSFSPFAIVAGKADSTADTGRTVVLAAEGHGKITADYTPGDNEVKGTVKFAPDEDYTFTITPDSGYVLENITFTGLIGDEPVKYSDGMFTLNYEDISSTNAIISVSFVKDTAEQVTVTGLCNHEQTKTTEAAVPVTCTTDGKTARIVCADCGQVISNSEDIPATGHVYESSEYTAQTCDNPGQAVLICKVCSSEATQVIPATGHDYVSGQCAICHEPEPCNIVFNANGGSFGAEGRLYIEKVNAGAKLESDKWPVPEREGYTFKGWYTTAEMPDSGDEVKQDNVFTKSMAVYAHWTEKTEQESPQPAVTWQISVSASPAGAGNVTGGGEYEAGKTVTVTANAASGYQFAYWTENGSVVTRNRTYTFTAAADRDLTAVFTWVDSGSGGSSKPSGGSTVNTTVTKNPDGSVTTTVIDKTTGTVTETTKYVDGSVKTIETKSNGAITTTEIRTDGVSITTEKTPGSVVTGSVTLPTGMAGVTVVIEAAVTPGTVVIDSATGKIIMSSVPVGSDGIQMTLDKSVSFRLEDRSMAFTDMNNHWARDSVAFVTAHGLFYGTGNGVFNPDLHMTRAMLMTVLARLNGVDTDGGTTWYEKGMNWAVETGISDGTAPESDITREQLATMLWRFAGKPAASKDLSGYPDSGEISSWADDAMRWAVQSGIIQGADGKLNPGEPALRSEVATMIERFCKNVGV